MAVASGAPLASWGWPGRGEGQREVSGGRTSPQAASALLTKLFRATAPPPPGSSTVSSTLISRGQANWPG